MFHTGDNWSSDQISRVKTQCGAAKILRRLGRPNKGAFQTNAIICHIDLVASVKRA